MKSKIEIYVGLKVREFRKKKDWTQQYLADVLNLSNTFIANRENPNEDDAFNSWFLIELRSKRNARHHLSWLFA